MKSKQGVNISAVLTVALALLLSAAHLAFGQTAVQPSDKPAIIRVNPDIPLIIDRQAVPVQQTEQKIAVPPVTGLLLDAAATRLKKAGLKLGKVSESSSDKPLRTVVSQSPETRTMVTRDSPVDVWISSGITPVRIFPLNTAAVATVIKVPDVTGRLLKDAAGALGRVGLKGVTAGEVASDMQKGSVVRQFPSPGTAVDRGSSVSLWISSGIQKPAARIVPEYREVVQGETAVFESQSSPAGMLMRESWEGPSGQQGSGSGMKFRTDQLAPGSYKILLTVMDRYEQTDSTSAVLKVLPPPQRKYRLKAYASPENIEPGGSARLTALLDPPDDSAEFRFEFGDGTSSGWIRDTETEHVYSSPGEFNASVAVRSGRRLIAEEGNIRVMVTAPLEVPTVSLKPDKENSKIDEQVSFEAIMSRPVSEAEYLFSFGDFNTSNWSTAPTADHAYKKEGTYKAIVSVKLPDGKIIESAPVTITAVKPPVPETGTREDTTTTTQPDRRTEPPARPEPRIHLNAEPASAVAGQKVGFNVDAVPKDAGLEYRFVFGDGMERAWDKIPAAEHVFSRPGTYRAYVTARRADKLLTESNPVDINVSAQPTGATQDQPQGIPEIIKLLIIASAIAGAYFLRSFMKRKKVQTAKPKTDFQAVPHMDPGDQFIGADRPLAPDFELRLRPVTDKGSQEITGERPLIEGDKSESREGE